MHNQQGRGQRPEPIPWITDSPIHQKLTAFALFLRAFFANKN